MLEMSAFGFDARTKTFAKTLQTMRDVKYIMIYVYYFVIIIVGHHRRHHH